MSRALTLYTHPWSRGRIARWMLEEVGAPYEVVYVDYGPPMKEAAYRAINPMGKVPALRHGEVVVTETAAICAYLADAFPAAGLAPPPGDPGRGPYYRWLFFAAGPLEAATTNHALGVSLPAGKEMVAGYGSLADVLATLDAELSERSFIVGDSVTAADIYLGAHLGWGMQFGTIEKRPAFERYAGRLYARPAAARAAAADDAAAPAHPMPGAPAT
jgi:glutathione S-transferase